MHLVDSQEACDFLSGFFVVTCKHNKTLNAELAQRLQGVLSARAQGVRNNEGSGKRLFEGHVNDTRESFDFSFCLVNLCINIGRARNTQIFEDEAMRANAYFFSIDMRFDAVRNNIFYLRVKLVRVVKVKRCRLICDGARHAVREVFLDASGDAKGFFPVKIAKTQDAHELRACLSERAGFVKNKGRRVAHSFEKFAALDDHTVFSRFVHGRCNGDGRRQLDSAGIIHHEDAQCERNAPGERQEHEKGRKTVGHERI